MHKDIIVVGAGISGIAAGYNLQKSCPNKSFAILEGRSSLGGTWDLFKYPGVRSDSDMHTLGFRFKPWIHKKSIADGQSILEYLNETVDEFKLREKISFNQKVISSNWSSDKSIWELKVLNNGNETHMTCNFLFLCGGYYSYDKPFMPKFLNQEEFQGKLIHPQFWDESMDYSNKKVIVIGSGATAITLVPAIAQKAEHVTMLQRSPSYVVSGPGEDPGSRCSAPRGHDHGQSGQTPHGIRPKSRGVRLHGETSGPFHAHGQDLRGPGRFGRLITGSRTVEDGEAMIFPMDPHSIQHSGDIDGV